MPIDDEIARIMRETRVIAVVGLSTRPERPSYGVARFLQQSGYRIIPVNPGHAGQEILGQTCHARLSDIPQPGEVDMIDIFRRPDAVARVVDEALAALPGLRVIWMQLGIRNEAAAIKARARGITVIEDRCPRMEFPRRLRAMNVEGGPDPSAIGDRR